jgi:uncharacterized protein (TIGR02466 family)
MPTHKIFPSFIFHESLKIQKKSNNGFSKLMNELIKESYQIAAADKKGQKWSQKNYPVGYTSYSSLSRLFELSSTFNKLKQLIDKKVFKFAQDCHMKLQPNELQMVSLWLNIMPQKATHSLHLHPLSTISGTVYLQTPHEGGLFKIEDPRLSKMMASPPRKETPLKNQKTLSGDVPGQFVKIQPKPGDIILFESWLRHEVEPHFTDADRISVSFNYNWF